MRSGSSEFPTISLSHHYLHLQLSLSSSGKLTLPFLWPTRFDDEKVSIVNRDKIASLDGGGEDSAAYILLYRCVFFFAPLPFPSFLYDLGLMRLAEDRSVALE